MKTLLLSSLLTLNLLAQPEPVREFKIYSSDTEVFGAPVFSGSIPSSNIKDFISFVISGKDTVGNIVSPIEVSPPYIPKFKVTWLPNKEIDLDHYLVLVQQKDKPESLITTKTTNTEVTIPYSFNTHYVVNVKAVNKAGQLSPPSESVNYIQEMNPPAAPVILPNDKQRYINVLTSEDGGDTYFSIGKIPYPKVDGQKRKTLLIEE